MYTVLPVLAPLLLAAPVAAEPVTYAPRPAGSCGTPQVPGEHAASKWALAPGDQRTIYLNRFGGTYQVQSGSTDSSQNIVNMRITGTGQRTAVIPPLGSEFDWPMISACVREHFAPYHVRIVEVEPTSGPYIEAVVGGSGTSIGFPANALLGIAAADNFCGVTEAGIAFNFAEAHRGIQMRDKELCGTIAHEIGHLLALEHEALPRDLMSYIPYAQTMSKSFVDEDSACGTSPQNQSACVCSTGTTNSHARLASRVGSRPVESAPPTLELLSPGDGRVGLTFEILARATDETGMSDVIALIDGVEIAGSNTPVDDQYRLVVHGVAEGPHTLTVIARDLANNETKVERSIVVAKLELGEACIAHEACSGELCVSLGEEMYCTQACDLSAQDCPDDYECVSAGSTAVCIVSDTGGCCSAGGGDGAAGILLLGVGVVILRRRKAPRA